MRAQVITRQEEELINCLKDVPTVKQAAEKLKIKPKTAYNVFYRLRKKYLKARRFVNIIEAQKRRDDRLAMILTDRMTVRELEKDNEETE